MGRRSRRRANEAVTPESKHQEGVAPQSVEPTPRAGRPSGRERPLGPWGSFPLSELTILIAIVLGVAGFIAKGTSGVVLIATAAVLGSLAGLELALREHLAGYRSHSTLLAGLCAMAVLALTTLVLGVGGTLSLAVRIAVSLAVFVAVFIAMRSIFKKRSGGLSFR